MLKGATPGVALVFLMNGPATNAASLAAYRRMLGTRGLMIYLIWLIAAALLWGSLLDWLAAGIPPGEIIAGAHKMLPAAVRIGSALLLLSLLALAVVLRFRPKPSGPSEDS